MASTLSDDDIRFWRERASAAEPYAEGEDPSENVFDYPFTAEELARTGATNARRILREHGIPLDEADGKEKT